MTDAAGDRLMPPRWFYGSVFNSMPSGLFLPRAAALEVCLRPLAPGERNLGRFIVPTFQRGLVWTEAQKVRLIESIYIGMPIGSLVYNQVTHGHPCDGWLLDGQQRMTAISEYVSGELAVRGWRYPDLPQIERRHFDRVPIALIETRIPDEGLCREVYDRLVYGGTPHDAKAAEDTP